MAGQPVRTVLAVLMDVLVVLAVVLVAALVIAFFGALAGQTWGKALVTLARPFTIPFGVKTVTTPYGGVFSVDLGLTVAVVLFVEWVLGLVRRQV